MSNGTKERILTDAEKTAILAARQRDGRPYFMPYADMTDEQRLDHIDFCDICRAMRDEILGEPAQ